ncbi:hypothetical protein SLE2022_090400 [Rubroshorea leprosula]|uniref:Expansin-like B1 n=1 Tax=Rubroshorea leprosula TaxID=152421 RepID=A0AAV5JHE0_9ROSI|nr:hypothetical protein SLEP1_g22102 [Rubroshorea leprosula]
MGSALFYCLLCVMGLFPALSFSQDDFVSSRATYYGSPDCYGTPSGACGFGEYGRTVYDGHVSGVSKLWRNGTGCGACYQVRCKNPELCADDGVNVVVTDYGEGDHTDFILSPRAYTRMAKSGDKAGQLFAYGVVDVDYRRVPCSYPGHKTIFKVHENSNYPNYLAIIILYQAGKNDVLDIQIWQEDCKQWTSMRRAYGAVFDMASPPKGPVSLRLQVSSSAGYYTWVEAWNVIPSDWKAGVIYQSDIELK